MVLYREVSSKTPSGVAEGLFGFVDLTVINRAVMVTGLQRRYATVGSGSASGSGE